MSAGYSPMTAYTLSPLSSTPGVYRVSREVMMSPSYYISVPVRDGNIDFLPEGGWFLVVFALIIAGLVAYIAYTAMNDQDFMPVRLAHLSKPLPRDN